MSQQDDNERSTAPARTGETGSAGEVERAAGRAGHEVPERFPDPGLPPHEPRPTDVDEGAAKRAERQVAGFFTVAALMVVIFVVCYFVVPKDSSFLGIGGQNLAFGLTLGLALLCLGIGAIQWSRKLIADHELEEQRHPLRSSDEDRDAAVGIVLQGAEESQIARRPLIRRSLIGALALLGVPPLLMLADLGPLPGNKSAHTIWRRGTRIVNDVTMEPLRLEDLELGQLVNAVPQSLEKLEGTAQNDARAKSAVILVKMEPNVIRTVPSKRNWGIGGVLCFSKVCTHVGCPVNLYEQQTHHLLCPCHQSTFDLSDQGRVVFGPAARNLPQLPIMVDADGFLVAQSDFHEPIGPSYWERG